MIAWCLPGSLATLPFLGSSAHCKEQAMDTHCKEFPLAAKRAAGEAAS